MRELSAENFHEICRLCLAKRAKMSSIFIETRPKRITSITAFEIIEGDGLPALICYNCSLEIDRSYEFKVMCQNSDTTLRRCLQRRSSESGQEGEDEEEDEDEEDNVNDEGFELSEVCSLKFESPGDYLMEKGEGIESLDQSMILETIEQGNSRHLLIFPEEYKLDVQVASVSERSTLNEVSSSLESETACVLDKDIVCAVVEVEETVKEDSKQRQHDKSVLRVKGTQRGLRMKHKSGDKVIDFPFLCTICSKSFPKRDNLKKHQIVHLGEKPYLCEECGKSFVRKQDLNVHRVTCSNTML